MATHLDVYHASLNKHGEQLCGDKVGVLTTPEKAIVVLSDGLGSGVKANILATMTTSILVTMLRANVSLPEVVKTVINSLPIDRVRKTSYATFTAVEIDRLADRFRVTNYDNPAPLFFHRGRFVELPTRSEEVLGRKLTVSEGQLGRGDFLALVSDGVLYAGVGVRMNFGWGRPNLAKHVESVFVTQPDSARGVVRDVVGRVNALYGDRPGDDATCAGIFVRDRHDLMVFTGPPLDRRDDDRCAERLLQFEGRKIVCGGTTSNLVARYLGTVVEPDVATMRDGIPPIGILPDVDLVTEGILTLSKTLDLLKDSGGDLFRLPWDDNGAVLLARELLRADSIAFLVGQSINEYYQNPLLPRNVSIRRNLVESLAQALVKFNRDVSIEYA